MLLVTASLCKRASDPWSIATCKVATAMDLGSVGSVEREQREAACGRPCQLVLSFAGGLRAASGKQQASSAKHQALTAGRI